nr:hypothetical protein [Candidatus Cloacimonadota bacterium]
AGMGCCGKISRLLHKHLGAAGTFVGLAANPTASGQLTAADVEMYHLQSINSNAKIGGIIGGEQIEQSLGLPFYNDYFHRHRLDAFYLPFTINSPDDFRCWLEGCSFHDKFYGFSITMPFKQKFSKDGKSDNLYLPQNQRFLNTDADAFQTALEFLHTTKSDRILIFGNGGSAHTALEALDDFENVFIYARKALNLQNFISLTEAKQQSFDLLINCTPVGMNEEDFLTETGIYNFRKVIDLPYCEDDTKLVTYCKEKNLPFIDGKQFWQWQAERQLIEFEKEINR